MERAAWRLASGAYVLLSDRAADQMHAFRQTDADIPEAGGVLIGRILIASGDITIDHATKPAAVDKRSRFRFVRAREPTQAIVDAAWAESDGYSIYLGEWHTHPEDVPCPSWLDRCNWKRIATRARYEQDTLLFLVVGRLGIGAWATDRDGKIAELGVLRDTADRSTT
jgi:integrative and conjugative element protein (TIGR02256 family)